jgi:hypothetical protein
LRLFHQSTDEQMTAPVAEGEKAVVEEGSENEDSLKDIHQPKDRGHPPSIALHLSLR